MYRQHPPFCCQVEATEGCNLRCPFCGINGIRDAARTYEYMTLWTARAVASNIRRAGWRCRLEFAMHGEPTQNPDLLAIIAAFRAALPENYFMMETNGSGFLGKDADDVRRRVRLHYQAGLDTIVLDEYQGVPWAARFRDFGGATMMLDMGVEFYEYPQQRLGNPHRRYPHKRFVIVAPIDLATSGTHSSLNNHCGSGAPLEDSAQGQRCAKPFREISIRWDGNVALCCNDWRGVYRIGNAAQQPLTHLWHAPAFVAARRKLLWGERTFTPCRGCNARSYRVGLLPDPLGKQTLPRADAACEHWLRAAAFGDSYTAAVERPWEREGFVSVDRVLPGKV